LLFVGLGTGLGSALVQDHIVVPIEMGHFTYSTGIWEDYIGDRGLKRLGKKKWRRHVAYGLDRLLDTFHPDDLVVGGGNAKKLKILPPGCRLGNNTNAFLGGFRLWQESVDLGRAA
jgi:predicted NBD/HSP70 family sugar kinase